MTDKLILSGELEFRSEWRGAMGGRREEWYIDGQPLGDIFRFFLESKNGDGSGTSYRVCFGPVRITIEVMEVGDGADQIEADHTEMGDVNGESA